MIARPLLLALALTAGFQSAIAKDESLLRKEEARKLNKDEQKLFGPDSSGRRYDPRMIKAAEIAKQRAQPKMTWHCWKYVKDALLAAGVVSSRPTTLWAKQAGWELCSKYGFVRVPVSDPLRAPVGAVVVYEGDDGGHVELRTATGFVSDFVSPTPYPRPLIGVYVKPS